MKNMRTNRRRAVPVLIAGLCLGWAADVAATRPIPDYPCPQETEERVDRGLAGYPDNTDLLLRKTICRIHKSPDYGLYWWEQAYRRDSAHSLYRLARYLTEQSYYDDDEILAGIAQDVVETYGALRGPVGVASRSPPPDSRLFPEDPRWQRIAPRAAYWVAGWYAERFIDLIWGGEYYRHLTPIHQEGKRPYEPAKALEQALRHTDTCMSASETAFADRAEHAFYSAACGKRREALLEIREMERERLAAAAWCRSRDKGLSACVVHDRVVVRMEVRQDELSAELRALHRSYLEGGAGGAPKPHAWDDDSGPAGPATAAEPPPASGPPAWLTRVLPDWLSETVPSEVRERFESAYQKWEAKGISDYRMWIERHCFCRVALRGPFIVDVRDGKPVKVVYALDGGPVPAGRYADLPTVDGLFEHLREAIEGTGRDAEADYHPLLGYPLSTGVKTNYVMLDADTNYIVHGLLADR